MQTEQILDITRQAMRVAVLLSAPLLLFGLVVGVLMNVFQAVTQITETTVAVVPKMAAMLLAQTPAASSHAAIEKQIVTLERAINDAVAKGDMKAFHANIAADAIGIDPSPIPSPTWASTVWTNKGGKWMAVFHQETAAMPAPTAAAKPATATPGKK